MSGSKAAHRRAIARINRRLAATCALCLLPGCGSAATDYVQGYVEGEFVYVASSQAGELQSLPVARGAQVARGELLFELESTLEEAARREAARRLAQARAELEDARKGKRPSELQSLQAQLKQAQSALALADEEATRLGRLVATGAVTEQEYDRAVTAREQSQQRVIELEADLTTARLGARSDQVAAAEAHVEALEAALAEAQWRLSQTRQTAEQDALVFDTLYREGEWVAAGMPVVALLPPANIKVRTFVPETRIAAIQVDDPVRVAVDGLAEPFVGKVSFISPRAEFTPPVIYSRESRSKLVFMVEAVFEPEAAAKLHPGQPVEVEF